MREWLDAFAEARSHVALFALQQLALEDCSADSRIRPSSKSPAAQWKSLMFIVDLGRLPRGRYSMCMPPANAAAAVDPIAVKAEQDPTQRERDRAL